MCVCVRESVCVLTLCNCLGVAVPWCLVWVACSVCHTFGGVRACVRACVRLCG